LDGKTLIYLISQTIFLQNPVILLMLQTCRRSERIRFPAGLARPSTGNGISVSTSRPSEKKCIFGSNRKRELTHIQSQH
jgi:hypothetical protein